MGAESEGLLDNIGMSQLAKNGYFSQSGTWDAFILHLQSDFLLMSAI